MHIQSKQVAICSCMAEKCAIYWLLHLRKKGIKPVWEADYEHLLQVSVDGEEEEEGVTMDYEEGDEEIGDEEEVDDEIRLDNDNDLNIND